MMFFNDSQGRNVNKTASLSISDQFEVPLPQGTTVSVVTLVLSVTGTFGNFLIIIAILKTPQLRRKPSNVFLLSLAVADLVTTVVAQPLFAAYVLLQIVVNRCNPGIDMAYMMAATLSSGSSINHLAAISIDRALATVKPHKHHSIMKKWSKVILSLCWGSVAIAAIGYFSIQILNAEKTASLILTILEASFIGIDFLLIISSYAIILYRIKFAKIQPTVGAITSTARERAMEKRVSKTIAIVIFLFSLCWFPVVGYRLSHPDTSAHCSFDLKYVWIRTLYLTNSSMNFIVYSLRIRQFRKAYVKIIYRMLLRSPGERNMHVTPDTVTVPLSIKTSSF